MKILKLEWRNVFSYGDDITTIEFGDTGKLWQLSGVSGSGKSSLLAIPKLLLFGKTEGSDGRPISVNEVANRLNKNGWIRGTIQRGSDMFIVERRFAPSGLYVEKNGTSLEQAGLKNMQDIIDNEILDGMPYHIFANVMTLSLNNFKSFISMTPADKRQIIDKIFSLELINKIHELVKKDKKELGNAINIIDVQIRSFEAQINSTKAQLENLINSVNQNMDVTIDEVSAKMETVRELYNNLNKSLNEWNTYYGSCRSIESDIRAKISQISTTISQYENQLRLFSMDRCPTCGTPFNSSEFEDIKTNISSSLDDQRKELETWQNQLATIQKSSQEAVGNINKLNTQITSVMSKQSELNAKIASVQAVATSTETRDALQNLIDKNTADKKIYEQQKAETEAKMKLLETMETVYSSDGIKQSMMSVYIPTLNEEIANVLDFLCFPYTLTFDNQFDPHLQHLGIDIKPQSLSTGEHKKVDLTVLCSLLKMIKRKYPQINLVCLDETVSSLDYESSAEIIKCLKDISAKMNMNIFVVSHTQLDENLFDEHLYVEKIAEYSVLTNLK